jgi:hypothetical protein
MLTEIPEKSLTTQKIQITTRFLNGNKRKKKKSALDEKYLKVEKFRKVETSDIYTLLNCNALIATLF